MNGAPRLRTPQLDRLRIRLMPMIIAMHADNERRLRDAGYQTIARVSMRVLRLQAQCSEEDFHLVINEYQEAGAIYREHGYVWPVPIDESVEEI